MKCAFCGEPINRVTKEEHHRVKRSAGGQDFSTNLEFICPRCHTITHQCEYMVKAGKSDEQILDFLSATLSGIDSIKDKGYAARMLLQAARDAAFLVERAPQKFRVIEVKAPVDLLKSFDLMAKDNGVRSRNDLILWCMKEMLAGRVHLPNGR